MNGTIGHVSYKPRHEVELDTRTIGIERLDRESNLYGYRETRGFLAGRPELMEELLNYARQRYPREGDTAIVVGFEESDARRYARGDTDSVLFGLTILYRHEFNGHTLLADGRLDGGILLSWKRVSTHT